MKKRITASLLALLLALSLVACAPPDLSGMLSVDGSGKYDESFVPSKITETVSGTFDTAYSNQLTPNETAIFEAIRAAAAGQNYFTVTLPERIELCKGGNPSDQMLAEAQNKISAWIANVLAVVRLELCEVFWLDTATFEYSLSTAFTSSGICYIDTLVLTIRLTSEMHLSDGFSKKVGGDAVIERQLLDLAALAASLDLTSGTEYERVTRINDYLCEHIEYTLEADERDNIVGALLNGHAVCEGYANAFLYLCRAAGLDCVNIVGDGVTSAGREGHMWSAVRVAGVWYLTDVTWNDTAKTDVFLLTGSGSTYADLTFTESHIPTRSLGDSRAFALPVCSETPYEQ